MMEEGLRKLYAGEYNNLNLEYLEDGITVVTLFKRGEKKLYQFKVKNLSAENEELLKHKEIEIKQPEYMKDRIRKAKENKRV